MWCREMKYTYTLSKKQEEKKEEKTIYRREELQGMSTYQLKEICRKERLVVPMGMGLDREGLLRFIMHYRGLKQQHHIKENCPEGLSRLQELLDRLKLKPDSSFRICFPSHLVLYQGESVELTDHYQVSSEQSLYEGNILLVDENMQIHTCFYLKKVKGKGFFLLKGKSVPLRQQEGCGYFMLYFKKEELSELCYHAYHDRQSNIPGQAECVLTPLLGIEIRTLDETELPLIIDFGSSNTTLGSYNHQGETHIVKVADESGEAYRESQLIPSVIGVKAIEKGRPVYCFGYEARALATRTGYQEDVPVFYDMKRWLSAPERTQQLITTEGIKLELSRREMLKAFFQYLVDTAQQQFKLQFTRIQLLAPVRQTERFEEILQQLFPEKQVSCTLDEGMAVLFHSIHELIGSGRYTEGVWYHALLMDCGGGTTDLTSGSFRILNHRISYEVDWETGYENGTTNFGGNNLTFRILQLLKLRILEVLGYGQFRFELEAYTGRSDSSYQALDRLYGEAEQLLPTRFADYRLRSREEYFAVKSNYYYLFSTAETVKESFFQRQIQYELWMGTSGSFEPEDTHRAGRLFLDKWRLSVRGERGLEVLKRELAFPLYLYEVEHLLRPEIYGLMERFFERMFIQGELSQYGMLKLTGQSCQSGLFTEALKEYVPGRLIRQERDRDDGSEGKLCCLQGAVAYFQSCRLGYVKMNQGNRYRALPYAVTAYTHERKEKILLHHLEKEQEIGYISRFRLGEQLDLYLRDEKGVQLRVYHFLCQREGFTIVTQNEINEQYPGTILQEETDIIIEGEIKFFVWPSRKGWGFVVLPVLREQSRLMWGEETFFAFEEDTWEENFFEGKK